MIANSVSYGVVYTHEFFGNKGKNKKSEKIMNRTKLFMQKHYVNVTHA